MILRQILRQGLILVLILFLAFPVWSNPGFVGTVTLSQEATIDGRVLTAGSAVLEGDTIAVGLSGGAWIALAQGMALHVGPSGQVRVSRAAEKIELQLLHGQAAIRLSETPIGGRLADAALRLVNDQPSTAMVDRSGTDRATLSVEKGALLVSVIRNGRTVAVHEGESLSLVPSAPQGPGREKSGSPLRGILIAAAILGGVTTAIGVLVSQRETQFSNQEKCNRVSPFNCR